MLEHSQVEPATVQSGGGRGARGRGKQSGASAPRPAKARARLAVALLRRHWLAAALLAAGLALRVLAQVAYRPVLFYIDTTRYLYNDAPGMDPLGYKGVLRAILAVANLNAVAAVQHLLGLAMAVVIYLLLLRRGCPRWLAALAMAPLLLDAYQVQIEQMLMPDIWFEALIVAGLAVLLWRRAPGWRTVLAAGLVLGTSVIVAQVGEALLLPAVIYLLALGGGWRQAFRKAGVLCAAPSATWSPGASSRPAPVLPRPTAGWRRRRTARRCNCRRMSGACAPPGTSRPSGLTSLSSASTPRSGGTTTACPASG
jgi:Dolichyl-phosphate-mannose-protein mannosyltransferase